MGTEEWAEAAHPLEWAKQIYRALMRHLRDPAGTMQRALRRSPPSGHATPSTAGIPSPTRVQATVRQRGAAATRQSLEQLATAMEQDARARYAHAADALEQLALYVEGCEERATAAGVLRVQHARARGRHSYLNEQWRMALALAEQAWQLALHVAWRELERSR